MSAETADERWQRHAQAVAARERSLPPGDGKWPRCICGFLARPGTACPAAIVPGQFLISTGRLVPLRCPFTTEDGEVVLRTGLLERHPAA